MRSGEARLVEVDPERIGTAVRAYELAAAGLTDREVAGRLDLGLHTVRGILTSPLYRGRLRDGAAANWPPQVDEALWQRVADLRAARGRRSPGRPETRRSYALPMLACAACGRRLVGDKDRYRHLDACEAFTAARPQGGDVRGRHTRIPGQSYGRDEYEAIVPLVLERVRLGAADVAAATAVYARGAGAEPDRLRVARIEEERERALAVYRRDRDPAALEQTMRELDAAEQGPATAGSARRCRPTRCAGTSSTCPSGGATRSPRTGARSRSRCSSGSRCWAFRRRPSTSARTRCGTALRRRCRRSWEYS